MNRQAGRQAALRRAPSRPPPCACSESNAKRTRLDGRNATAPPPPQSSKYTPNQTKPNQNNNSYGAGADREGDAKVDRALEEVDKRRMAEATWTFDGQVRGGVGRAAATAAAVCFWVRG